ncbi:MAG TPA: sigma 54-interacting transcriptional regulator [Polyangia bacterium]
MRSAARPSTTTAAARPSGGAGVPTLGALHPAAARWIGALIRMTAPHPAMTRILDVIERLQDRPFPTNVVLLGEPGTGKEGLARALHHLISPGAPLVRLDVGGFPEREALVRLCGDGKHPGAAQRADGGALLIEEVATIGPQVQEALLRILKTGVVDPADAGNGVTGAAKGRLRVRAIVMSDRDLGAEVAAGRFRHDLYYRLARVVLWLPPLRERPEDIAPAALWMGNRILRDAGSKLELMSPEQFQRATPAERAAALEMDAGAVRALEEHGWPGNLRELEAVIERALLLFRKGALLGAPAIRAALGNDETPRPVGHS